MSSLKFEDYSRVGVGAWAAKALYDETVTAILIKDFTKLSYFIDSFPRICQKYGGHAASIKLQKAAHLLKYNLQDELADELIGLGKSIVNQPIAPSCLNLSLIDKHYNSYDLIKTRVETICQFLKCLPNQLESLLQQELDAEQLPKNWKSQVSYIYEKCYTEWFTPFAINHLHKYCPQPIDISVIPCLQVIDWSAEVWRCWRLLGNQPTLIDPGIFKPSQFFVWHIVHDSVHIWQMQAYRDKWSNILSPEDFLLLESQAMCAEIIALELMQEGKLKIPDFYPVSNNAVILRLLLGLLEREIRLDLDLSVHLHGKNVNEWLLLMAELTGLSSKYFLGFTGELLGMPGFASAYIAVTDSFMSLEDNYRYKLITEKKLSNIPYLVS